MKTWYYSVSVGGWVVLSLATHVLAAEVMRLVLYPPVSSSIHGWFALDGAALIAILLVGVWYPAYIGPLRRFKREFGPLVGRTLASTARPRH